MSSKASPCRVSDVHPRCRGCLASRCQTSQGSGPGRGIRGAGRCRGVWHPGARRPRVPSRGSGIPVPDVVLPHGRGATAKQGQHEDGSLDRHRRLGSRSWCDRHPGGAKSTHLPTPSVIRGLPTRAARSRGAPQPCARGCPDREAGRSESPLHFACRRRQRPPTTRPVRDDLVVWVTRPQRRVTKPHAPRPGGPKPPYGDLHVHMQRASRSPTPPRVRGVRRGHRARVPGGCRRCPRVDVARRRGGRDPLPQRGRPICRWPAPRDRRGRHGGHPGRRGCSGHGALRRHRGLLGAHRLDQDGGRAFRHLLPASLFRESSRGNRVRLGQDVGAVGTSGRRSISAPHLHFGVREAGSRHAYQDPLDLLPPPGTPPVRDRPRVPVPVGAPVRVGPSPEPVRSPSPRRTRVPRRVRVPAGRRVPLPGGRRLPVPARPRQPVPLGHPAPRLVPLPGARRVPSRAPNPHGAPSRGPAPAHVPKPEGHAHAIRGRAATTCAESRGRTRPRVGVGLCGATPRGRMPRLAGCARRAWRTPRRKAGGDCPPAAGPAVAATVHSPGRTRCSQSAKWACWEQQARTSLRPGRTSRSKTAKWACWEQQVRASPEPGHSVGGLRDSPDVPATPRRPRKPSRRRRAPSPPGRPSRRRPRTSHQRVLLPARPGNLAPPPGSPPPVASDGRCPTTSPRPSTT